MSVPDAKQLIAFVLQQWKWRLRSQGVRNSEKRKTILFQNIAERKRKKQGETESAKSADQLFDCAEKYLHVKR